MEKNNQVNYSVGNSDLLPLSNEKRTLGPVSYVLSWIGAVININSFMMGAALVPPTGVLNLVQSILAMIVGVGIIVVLMTLNGVPGHKYGIPFVIHAIPAFGKKGAIFPSVIRAVPAVLWYGIQTWIGAGAINTVMKVLFGFDNIMLCFIVFLVLQILLSSLGFKGIKWIENFGAAFIIFALTIMFIVIYDYYKSDIIVKLIEYEGKWGYEWVVGMVTFGATYATYVITMSDIIRELKTEVKTRSTYFYHLIGVLPFTMFMAIIGLLTSGVTGSWDPIAVFTEILPNKPLLIMTLLFIAIAQITTNVLMNVVPSSYVLMQYTKISYKKACIVVGIVAGLTMPWKLTTGAGFTLFVQVMSAFLIPAALVMLVDFYWLRGKEYDLDDLYAADGPFKGVNWNGIIAIVVGAVVALIFHDLSWLIGSLPTVVTYMLLMKYGNLSKEFKKGTKLNK